MRHYFSNTGILIAIFVVALNWSIVNTGLPAIQLSLNASLTELQWLMNAFGLAMVPFLVMMGRCADIYGRKKIYLAGTLLFAIPSLFGGLTTDVTQLIMWRGMQGFACAILLPVSLALITLEFPKSQKGKAIGLWMLAIGLGCGLGPLIGGILISAISWRWIFFFNLPFSLISFLFCLFCTRESKEKAAKKKLDIMGNLTLIIAIASLTFAIVQGPDWGWTSPLILTLFTLACLFISIFYLIETKTQNPIIEFHFYLNERFLSASIGVFFVIFFVWGAFFLLPIYLQNILHFKPYQAGLLLLLITIPFSLVSSLVGHLGPKIHPKYAILTGVALLGLSASLGLFFTTEISYTLLFFSLISFGIGWGTMFGPCVNAGISTLPTSKTGLAAGSLNTLQEIGGSTGLAILGAILRNVDKNHLFTIVKEKGLSFSPPQIAEIHRYISNPTILSNYLKTAPSHETALLLSAAYSGFMKGFHTAMYTLIGLSILVFFFILFYMKRAQKCKS